MTLHDDSNRLPLGGLGQRAVFVLLALLLIVAPLFRSGQPSLARMGLELTALAILFAVLWSPPRGVLSRLELLALGLLLLYPLLYLIPFPSLVSEWLPGRQPYFEADRLIGLDPSAIWSIVPSETQSAFFAMLLPVAVYIGTRCLSHARMVTLVKLLIGIAAVQAVFGLMQFGGGKESGLYLGMEFTHFGSAVGTYTNKNHLAGLIEMVLPIVLALLLYSTGRRRDEAIRNLRTRIAFIGSVRGHASLVYGLLVLLLLVGVIFSRSRAGIALAMVGILLATFAFSRRIGGDNVYGPVGTVITIAVGLGIVIGLAPVLDRFAQLDPVEDGRWAMFSATINGIGSFFPLGSGPGTYAAVFPAFQPVELGRWFVNYAHNDYLQWLFEGGLPVAALALLLLGIYLYQWTRVWTSEAWSRFRFIQIGAGIGMLLLLLHELVDYNLHMPANMVYFAFLAGLFFSDADQEPVSGRPRRKRRRTPDLVPTEPEEVPAPIRPVGPHPQQIPNPFLD